MITIRCSRCGQTVPYKYENFVEVKGEPVCKQCLYGTTNMTNYLNKLNNEGEGNDRLFTQKK